MIFFGIFLINVMMCKYIDIKHYHRIRLNKEIIDYYNI